MELTDHFVPWGYLGPLYRLPQVRREVLQARSFVWPARYPRDLSKYEGPSKGRQWILLEKPVHVPT